MVATINPCGFAMLPAYLSYFLGLDDPSSDAGASIFRALAVSAAVSSGFLAVFVSIGVLISGISNQLRDVLPWVTMSIGVILVCLGVAMLRGYEPMVSLPRLNRGAGSREISSMFLFGVSYAVASLSCSIGVFLTTMTGTLTGDDFVGKLQAFVAYALGMALVLMVLTLAIALARQSIVRHLRRMLPYVHRIAGALLVAAGCYLAYYGWYEWRVINGDVEAGGPARMVFDWNATVANWVQQTGAWRIGLVLGAIVAAALILAFGIRSTRAPTTRSTEKSRRNR